MRAVVQRVSEASVTIVDAAPHDSGTGGSIGAGLVILLGVGKTDTEGSARQLSDKILHLRIFADHAGRMNLDLRQAGGSLLVVSQFTLFADTRKGRRPGFDAAADPQLARSLYETLVRLLRQAGQVVETGVFGAHMRLQLVNDGPVTIILDSEKL